MKSSNFNDELFQYELTLTRCLIAALEGGYANLDGDKGSITLFGVSSKYRPAEFREIARTLGIVDEEFLSGKSSKVPAVSFDGLELLTVLTRIYSKEDFKKVPYDFDVCLKSIGCFLHPANEYVSLILGGKDYPLSVYPDINKDLDSPLSIDRINTIRSALHSDAPLPSSTSVSRDLCTDALIGFLHGYFGDEKFKFSEAHDAYINGDKSSSYCTALKAAQAIGRWNYVKGNPSHYRGSLRRFFAAFIGGLAFQPRAYFVGCSLLKKFASEHPEFPLDIELIMGSADKIFRIINFDNNSEFYRGLGHYTSIDKFIKDL